ncbi:MAG TPA: XdhC family protein [Candidatus Limnocylindrales bacterium]|nr:XdhC family protein [Candidatus Limnocylindrales bacterium]
MRELLPVIEAWRAEGVGFGRAVLVRALGSAPRPPGATLLVADDGRLAGSVSGGCVEGACIEEVVRARRERRARVHRYGISDETAWSVGLACGSTVDVLVEPELREELIEALRSPDDEVVVTQLPADAPTHASVPSLELGQARQRGLAEGRSQVVLAGGEQHFVEAFPTVPRLVIFGATDVAQPLARLAHVLGWEVVVADARAAFATAERFPEADQLMVGWPDELAQRLALGQRDSVVVLTHDPKLDDPAITVALQADCRYVGAIGSRRTQRARRQRLSESGLHPQQVERLHGPVGLDLGGREPAEVALAIIAQVVATRYGAGGGAMPRE